MATPRKVARDLRQTATRIARISDAAVADAATVAVELGAGVGGRFGSRRGAPLTVVVRSVSNARNTSTATVGGKPAGAWSIKSYGRRGGYTVRPRRRSRRQALNVRAAGINAGGRTLSAIASTRPGATSGDDRWNRYIREPIADQFTVIAEDLAADAVGGR